MKLSPLSASRDLGRKNDMNVWDKLENHENMWREYGYIAQEAVIRGRELEAIVKDPSIMLNGLRKENDMMRNVLLKIR